MVSLRGAISQHLRLGPAGSSMEPDSETPPPKLMWRWRHEADTVTKLEAERRDRALLEEIRRTLESIQECRDCMKSVGTGPGT